MGQTDNVDLHPGYYHRFFRFDKSGAMGLKSVARGFNDANMWVAQTNQPRIAPLEFEVCNRKQVMIKGKLRWMKVCEDVLSRFSYAIPLEIIYLTPLQTWNPYNIETGKETEDVIKGGRNGQVKQSKAYNGTDHSKHYLTPTEFFKGRVDGSDPADTVRGSVGVLDRQGVMRKTTASGVKVILQEIEGVGKVRLRYPIAPIHGEGSAVWKELNALKKQVRDKDVESEAVCFVMSTTFADPPGVHEHEFTVTRKEYDEMLNEGKTVSVVTTSNHDHSHPLDVHYNKDQKQFEYRKCGGASLCWDKHPKPVTLTSGIL